MWHSVLIERGVQSGCRWWWAPPKHWATLPSIMWVGTTAKVQTWMTPQSVPPDFNTYEVTHRSICSPSQSALMSECCKLAPQSCTDELRQRRHTDRRTLLITRVTHRRWESAEGEMKGSVLVWEWGVEVEGGWEAPAGGRGGFKNRGVRSWSWSWCFIWWWLTPAPSVAQHICTNLQETPRTGIFRNALLCTTHINVRSPPLFAAILKQLPPRWIFGFMSHMSSWSECSAQAETLFSRHPFPFSPSDKGTFCLCVPARVLACIYLCDWVGRTSAATWRRSSIPLSESARSPYVLRSHICTKLPRRRNFWVICKSVSG